MHPKSPPWEATLTSAEHDLVYYFLVVAGLALLAQLLRTLVSQGEVGPRYRGATLAGLAITGVAFVSYVSLVVKFDLGYDRRGDVWVPNSDAMLSYTPRYMDWSITVPLLVVELIAVSALAGAAARRVRLAGVSAAFLMILTGYLGGVVIDGGRSLAALWTWGLVSAACMVAIYVLVIAVVVGSLRRMSREAASAYRAAMILLLVVWFVYPVVFGFQGFVAGGGWTVGAQVALSVADVVAKVGFGMLIHKVAKLRTAEDVVAAEDVHPESVWTSGVKKADAALPPVGVQRRSGAAAGQSSASRLR